MGVVSDKIRDAAIGKDDHFDANKASFIGGWLPLFFEPDDVLEIRILDADGCHGKTVAGYLLARNIPGMAEEIARRGEGASGVYFTPQRLNAAVLGRSPDLLVDVERDVETGKDSPALTSDADVAGRRFLILNINAKRPDWSVSATDDELIGAYDTMNRLTWFIVGSGWSLPLTVCSGNGFHMYFRLPEEQPGSSIDSTTDRIAVLLHLLARNFNTPKASVDTATFDPARLMRVPGTMARKGDEAGNRHHRMCQVAGYPAAWSGPHPEDVRGPGVGDIETLIRTLDPSAYVPPTKARTSLLSLTIEALDPDGSKRDRLRRGESKQTPAESPSTLPLAAPSAENLPSTARRIDRAIRYMAKIGPSIQGQKGSSKTLWAARVLVHGFLLDPASALTVLRVYNDTRCEPIWSDKELEHKISEAVKKPFRKDSGWLVQPRSVTLPTSIASPPAASGGQQEPRSSAPKLNESEKDPHRLADKMLKGYRDTTRRLTLVFWQGQFHEWDGTHYKTIAELVLACTPPSRSGVPLLNRR